MLKKYRVTVLLGVVALLMLTSVLVASQKSDRRIENNARKTYVFSTYLRGDDIQINCASGVVTLTGTVNEESHILLAGETVSDLRGVKRVHNQLVVKGDYPVRSSDAWIHRKIKAMLLLHRNLDGENTEVFVKDGQVTLRGEASSQAEKGLTTEYVKDVEGVRDVNNEMTVAERQHEKHRSFGAYVDDSSIKSQIKLALLFHRGTNAFTTQITVRRGIVTVTGTAGTMAEKELVSRRIEDVPGVLRIRNRMIIK